MTQTTDDVLPILYLPTSTPEFERGIWEAVLEAPGRDWDETECEYLRRNDGIRNTLIEEAVIGSVGYWTKPNLTFLRHYLIEFTFNP
jgi:hypothetical protein